MKNPVLLFLVCGALVATPQKAPENKGEAANPRAGEAAPQLAGFVETLDPQKVLMSLSFRLPPAADGKLGRLIINQAVRGDGTFTLAKPLPKESVVETVPDKCVALKTLIIGEETVVSELLAATAGGVTQTRTNLNIRVGSISIGWSSNERFTGIDKSAGIKVVLPGLQVDAGARVRNGGITFGCPGSDSKEASK